MTAVRTLFHPFLPNGPGGDPAVHLLICEAPFRFSSRYEGRQEELIEEAAEAFGGPVVVL